MKAVHQGRHPVTAATVGQLFLLTLLPSADAASGLGRRAVGGFPDVHIAAGGLLCLLLVLVVCFSAGGRRPSLAPPFLPRAAPFLFPFRRLFEPPGEPNVGGGQRELLHGITTMGEDKIMVEPKIQWPHQQHRQIRGFGFLFKMDAICHIWAQRHGIPRRARPFSRASRNWLAMAPRRRPPRAVRMANDTLAMNAIIDEVMGAAAVAASDAVTPSTTPTSRSSQAGLEVNSAGVRDQIDDQANSAGLPGSVRDQALQPDGPNNQDAQPEPDVSSSQDGSGSNVAGASMGESVYHEPEADVAETAADGVWTQEENQQAAMEVVEEAKPFLQTRAKARPKASAATASTTFSRTLPALRIGRIMRRHILADNEEPPPWWSGDATRTVPRAAPYRPPPSPMSSRRRDQLIGEARAQALYWCDRVFDLEG